MSRNTRTEIEVGDVVKLLVSPWVTGPVTKIESGKFTTEILVEAYEGPVLTAPEYVRIVKRHDDIIEESATIRPTTIRPTRRW